MHYNDNNNMHVILKQSFFPNLPIITFNCHFLLYRRELYKHAKCQKFHIVWIIRKKEDCFHCLALLFLNQNLICLYSLLLLFLWLHITFIFFHGILVLSIIRFVFFSVFMIYIPMAYYLSSAWCFFLIFM